MAETDARPPAAEPPPDRDRPSPLPWILLLLALVALGWFIYTRFPHETRSADEALPPAPVAVPDEREEAAVRERARDDARRAADRAADAKPADREPEPLARVQPEYPAAAYRERAEGTVLLGVTVDASGRPAQVDVVERSGSRELDRAAVEAVRQWTFAPAIRGGRPAEARVEIPVTFRLEQP